MLSERKEGRSRKPEYNHCTHTAPRPDQARPGWARSISDAGKIIAEFLDGLGRGAGLDGFGVVGDEDGLGSLDDDDAFLALLPVQTPVVGFDDDVPVAADPEAVALHLLHIALVLVCGYDFFDLGGGDL